jgi:hypothetical protein
MPQHPFSTGWQAAFARVATSIKLKINLRSQSDGEIYPPVLVVEHTVVDIPAVQPSTTSSGGANANTQVSGDAAASLPVFTFTFKVSVDLPLVLSQFSLLMAWQPRLGWIWGGLGVEMSIQGKHDRMQQSIDPFATLKCNTSVDLQDLVCVSSAATLKLHPMLHPPDPWVRSSTNPSDPHQQFLTVSSVVKPQGSGGCSCYTCAI